MAGRALQSPFRSCEFFRSQLLYQGEKCQEGAEPCSIRSSRVSQPQIVLITRLGWHGTSMEMFTGVRAKVVTTPLACHPKAQSHPGPALHRVTTDTSFQICRTERIPTLCNTNTPGSASDQQGTCPHGHCTGRNSFVPLSKALPFCRYNTSPPAPRALI